MAVIFLALAKNGTAEKKDIWIFREILRGIKLNELKIFYKRLKLN